MAFVSGVALTRTCWDCIGLVFLAAVAGVCTVGFLFQTPALKQTAQADRHEHVDKPPILTKPKRLSVQTLYKGMLLYKLLLQRCFKDEALWPLTSTSQLAGFGWTKRNAK